jgi:polyisoprenoid-binding protein YceI
LIAGLIVFGTSAGAAASEWKLVDEQSAVTMFADKQGTAINGDFAAFTAEIDFDPTQPGQGRIVGVVETGSIETHDAQNNTYIVSYLDSMQFPEARFESTSIEAVPGGFRASGELTLKGITRPVALDFVFETEGESLASSASASLRGGMNLDRFDFDIASDLDVNVSGKDVYVQVELSLEQ